MPLIKTHDKRFLIKAVRKEEKDIFLRLLPKYHQHLKKNPKSILSKILGIYAIKIEGKDKVYQILMESVDPVDESFIRFKYDLKFSSINRDEFKNSDECEFVRKELLKKDADLQELFPTTSANLSQLKHGALTSDFRGGSDSRSGDGF